MKNVLRNWNVLAAALLVVGLFLVGDASAQTLGEYRSRQTGNWNAPGPNGTWEQWNGANWVTEYPVATPGSVATDGFPVVVGTATSAKTSQSGTTHTIALPAGIQNGDLLLIFWTDEDQNNTAPSTPSGFTQLYTSTNGDRIRRAWYKVADGTEGTSINVTGFEERSAHTSYRIAAGTYTGTPYSNVEIGTNSNPNPPNLSPGIGAQNFLWIAASHSEGNATGTAPANYEDLIFGYTGNTGSNHARMMTATRKLNAASEDPGNFALGTNRIWAAATVAIQGQVGAVPHPVVVGTGAASSSTSNSTSHTITSSIPSGETGNLLVVVFSVDGNPTVSTSSTGWTKLGQANNGSNVTGAVFWKMADGTTSASDPLVLTTSASEQSSHIVYRIRGATGISGAAANGNSTNSDPPSHTALEASYLWIATRSGDNTTVATAPPTGYTNMITQAASGNGGASSNAAINILGAAATTQNPGTFASGEEQWVSWTLAIEGPAPVITMVPIAYPESQPTSFPVVAGVAQSNANGNATSHTVSLPSGVEVGDLLVVIMGFRGGRTYTTSTVQFPAGWTELVTNTASSDGQGVVYYKVATGVEAGASSITVAAAPTGGTGARSAHTVYRIQKGTYTGTPEAAFINATTMVSSTNPNPPSLTPSWGTEKVLWIAGAAGTRAETTPNTGTFVPTDFESGTYEFDNSGTTTSSASVSTAIRYFEGSTLDPGSFTLTTTVHRAFTIAIQGVPPTIATVRSPHTVTVTADVTVDEVTIESGGTVVVNNGITFTTPEDGTFDVDGTLQMGTDGSAALAGDGAFSLNSGGTLGVTSADGITSSGATGNIQNTGTRTFSTGANYEYNGSAAQNTGNGLPATVNSLTIDNAAGVTLTNSVEVTGTLDLSAGLLNTGANSVTVTDAGSIANALASSYVNGNLCRGILAGANSYAFPIGRGSVYAPVSIDFQAGTTAGTLCGSTANGDHPDILNSDVDEDASVNRYWSFNILSGLGTANYDATFNWVNADEDMDFDFNDAIVGKYDNPNWTYPTVGTKTATSVQITGESGFSDFQVGAKRCDDISAAISGTTTICSGGSANLTVTITGGTGPYEVVYTDGTNNFTVMNYTSGGNISVSPSTNTTYTLVSVTDDKGCPAATLTGSAVVTVVAQPVGPTLLAKSPNLATVCDGQDVSATFTAGTGGFGCADSYQYSTDNGGTWNPYTPGDLISTTGSTGVIIQGKRDNCTSGAGCTGTSYVTLASWAVVAQPVGPTLLAKSPDLTMVCEGQSVSATFNAGSGGTGCTDDYVVIIDGGTPVAYTPGSNVGGSATSSIVIQGRRADCTSGSGCTGTSYVTLASWTVVPQPVGPTLLEKYPDLTTVCEGQSVSATFYVGTYGYGCTNSYQFSTDNGVNWNPYTPFAPISTTGATVVLIQGKRDNCTTGAGCTGTSFVTLASWTVVAQPSAPTLLAKSPNLTTVCEGQSVSATFTAGTGGFGCSDSYQYSTDNGSTWNPYTPNDPISTMGATVVLIQGKRDNCTSGAGCTGTSFVTLASWTIEPTPIAGTLAKIPNDPTLCEGTDVSATLTAGSGGNGTDLLEFSIDGGTNWDPYISGDPIPTSALSSVQIRTRRLGGVCSPSSYNEVSWTITPEPSLSDAGPDQSVCFPNPATLAANAPATGNGAWSVESGPDLSASQFSSASAPNATFTPSAAGTYVLRWTISNAPCNPYTDEVTVTATNCVTLSGTLTWRGNNMDGVAGATVSLSGDATASTGPTTSAGAYTLVAPSGSDFVITPSKSAALLNGVDVGDAAAIQQHLVGISTISDLYRRVAADLNKNGNISTVDAAVIVQTILNNPFAIAVFNNAGSWRFIPTSHTLSMPNIYTFDPIPESRTLTGASGTVTDQDFFGIKVGDVDETAPADPDNLTGDAPEPLIWLLEDRVLQAGETVEAEFRVRNFTDLAAFQFALGFDPQLLQYTDMEVLDAGLPLSADGNFGRYNIHNGELRAAYASATGATLPANTPLFKVYFTALSSGERLSELLRLDHDIIPATAFTSELERAAMHLVFTETVTSVQDPSALRAQLLQNRPNPFDRETVIGFVLPDAGEAQLRVLDMSGRELWRVVKQYGAGYHEEIFRPSDGYAGGILLYELRTPHGVQTRKMVWTR